MALDRDRKRPHENPSIGVLLCRTKDDEVVEYAMSRHLSPALVAQYETQMIPKAVLQQKLHEWSRMLEASDGRVRYAIRTMTVRPESTTGIACTFNGMRFGELAPSLSQQPK